MQESRPLIGSAIDSVWLLRSRFLNGCLLVVSLALAVVGGASVAVQLGNGSLNLSILEILLLVGSAAWLIVAYLLSRRRRFRLAGGMVVGLVVVALALAIYLLPGSMIYLLPITTLPVGLAALLLSRRAIYLVAVAMMLGVIGALTAAQLVPPPPLGLRLPLSGPIMPLAVMALALLLLSLTLAPLRSEIARLFEQLRRSERLNEQAEAQRAEAEQLSEQAQSARAWQQSHTNLILKQIGDGVIAVDPAGKIVRANVSAQAIWAEVVGGDILEQPFDQVAKMLTGQSAATQHATIIPIADDATACAEGYTHILRDEREQARFARLRGELLGLLADEMRNPLTSMVTALEMTLGQNLPDGADRVLVGARRSGQRLLDLVTTLLEISQIEQNPAVLRRSSMPLRPILEAGIAQTGPLAQQGAVTVVVEPRGDGAILIDGDRMRNAFVYLMEHALRHSPPYSTVQVRIERQNGSVVVRIVDQGPGLTPQQREVLFDQRAMPDERSAPALGLAFSKLVIEAHGGRVWVESSGSQGSTYAFSLPVEK